MTDQTSVPDHTVGAARPSGGATTSSAGQIGPGPQAGVPDHVQPTGLGAIFTRRWAAELVLDLAGYTSDKDLAAGRAIEPSCGGGAFLTLMIERLAKSCANHGHPLERTTGAIRAWDLDPTSVSEARAIARRTLRAQGVSAPASARLARRWIQQGDFLLIDHEPADWVVGNPPYVRLEDVPAVRSTAYRHRWDAMQGRADVYVGFIQAGLRALRPQGVLGFICADRWMRNQYGKRLRHLIEDHYAVDTVVTLHDSDPFEDRVNAYPAIFSIRSGTQGAALVVDADAKFGSASAQDIVELHNAGPDHAPIPTTGLGYGAAWTKTWFAGSQSWPTGAPHRVALVADLEQRHVALGEHSTGIRLGIGLATGADAVYLTHDPGLVEADRLLPVVMSGDLADGTVKWSGTHLVNPWEDDGRLVALSDYPRLRRYLNRHGDRLRGRHVARRQPSKWHRTIDRPVPGLAEAPKLVIPDLRPRVTPVLEDGGLYPQHNLFWITSDTWDLRVLGGLLLSEFGTLFVETYSPRMAGGALRVTAQYLRRVRVPDFNSISPALRAQLAEAFDARDIDAATRLACKAYDVDPARLGWVDPAEGPQS